MISHRPPNNRVNATVRSVTPLAVASVAPVPPACYTKGYTALRHSCIR